MRGRFADERDWRLRTGSTHGKFDRQLRPGVNVETKVYLR